MMFQAYATPAGLPPDERRDFLGLYEMPERAAERVRLQIARGAGSGFVKQGFDVVLVIRGAPEAPARE